MEVNEYLTKQKNYLQRENKANIEQIIIVL